MRSAAPGSSTSTTARSHASGPRPVTAPAPSTTAASLERNTRSRASRKTRLASDRLHGHDRPGGRRAVPQVAQRGLPGAHQAGAARRWPVEPLEGEEGRGADPAGKGDMVKLPMPHPLKPFPSTARESLRVPPSLFPVLDKHVLLDLIDPVGDLLARVVEERVERLPLLAREILLRRPIVGLERTGVRAQFEMVAQLVGERLPRLLAPIEATHPGQRREGAVVEHDAGLEVGAVATPFERNALAQRVDVAPNRVRHGLGAHLDHHHPIEVRRRDLPQEPLDELPEVIEPHRQYVGSGTRRCAPRPRLASTGTTPHSPRRSAPELVPEELHQAVGSHSDLRERIPVPYRDGAVLRRLPVDRDAEWRSGLVLAAVAAPDRATVVVEGVAVVATVVRDAP